MKRIILALFAIAAQFLIASCASSAAPAAADRGIPTMTVTERSAPGSSVSRIREIDASDPNIPESLDGYRIAFVSDIHFGNRYSRKRLDRLVAEINAQNCDCVILGGDYTRGRKEFAEFARAVSTLSATEGVYAVMGNHDFYNGRTACVASLRESGIVVLDETTVVTPRGLTVAGINDFRDVYPPMGSFLETLPKEGFALLVSHDPDFAEKAAADDLRRFGLMLAGHLHGGQITFFGYAPILPTEYGQKYRTGTIYKNGVPVIVSNGAGFSGDRFRFRLFAPSDFLVITLRSTAPTKAR